MQTEKFKPGDVVYLKYYPCTKFKILNVGVNSYGGTGYDCTTTDGILTMVNHSDVMADIPYWMKNLKPTDRLYTGMNDSSGKPIHYGDTLHIRGGASAYGIWEYDEEFIVDEDNVHDLGYADFKYVVDDDYCEEE